MARRSPATSDARPARRTTGDPYGLAAARPFLAPLLSFAGLAIAGVLTLALLTGNFFFLPTKGSRGPGSTDTGGAVIPGRTPSPSAPPVVDPRISIDGMLVFAKAGNLWVQEGKTTRQLTSTGRDSQPAWSADGTWVYFIDTRETRGRYPINGIQPSTYDLFYPVLSRIHPDGSGREVVLSGLYKTGRGRAYTWSYFVRDPAVSPDGKSVIVASDGPDPSKSDVVLARVTLANKRLTPLGVAENPPYGHQDPAWRPDGAVLVYVQNARVGGKGAPAIWRYDPVTKKASRLSQDGYSEPSFSPDGRYLVATKTSTLGTDVVVLDARNGNELLRVTADGRSWGGAWSPDGTQIVFLRLTGSTSDLDLATLAVGPNGDLSVASTKPLTEFSGLDPESHPAWWAPAAAPTATPSISPSATPAR